MRKVVLAVVVLLVSLAGWPLSSVMAGARFEQPRFELIYQKRSESGLSREILATLAQDAVVFDISDEAGIGKGTIRLVEGVWPAEVFVRFHLTGLEGVTVTVGGKALADSELVVRVLDMKGNPLKGKYLLKKQGYYELRIPAATLSAGTKEIKLTWVDFYRH